MTEADDLNIRVYRWAWDQWRTELEQDFPFVRSVHACSAQPEVELTVFNRMPRDEALRVVRLL